MVYRASNILYNSPSNFLEQMVLCGAETVVGFDYQIKNGHAKIFEIAFLYALVEMHYSIGQATDHALDTLAWSVELKNRVNGDAFYSGLEESELRAKLQEYAQAVTGHVVVAGNSDNRLR